MLKGYPFGGRPTGFPGPQFDGNGESSISAIISQGAGTDGELHCCPPTQ